MYVAVTRSKECDDLLADGRGLSRPPWVGMALGSFVNGPIDGGSCVGGFVEDWNFR